MTSARFYVSPAVNLPTIINEPILTFAPGSQERKDVEKVLMLKRVIGQGVWSCVMDVVALGTG